ncbi:hypothetical protein [Antarctobacter sp.]|uniref:hypothetical protein n=1 Tax=Antarctobacter sp. TaxID=1872577 RepID=UPI002B278BFD|nr:hypothetical protein [Antarctobacter sp.]
MKHTRFAVTLGLALSAGALHAQEPPVCDAVLVALAESRLSGDLSAMNLIRDETPLFDAVALRTPEAQPVFSGYFGRLAERQRDPVDFNTTGAFRHEGCVEVTGLLRTDRTLEELPRRDGTPMPVSVFVFNEGVFDMAFLEGPSITETNARMSVGPLLFHPDLREGGALTAQGDAFASFSVAPYIANEKDTTLGKADYAWMGLDLRQGKGRQLVAVTCDRPCSSYLNGFKTRLLAASGPVIPVAPPVTKAPDAGGEDPKLTNGVNAFTDETLSITLIGPEEEVILLESLPLQEAMAQFSHDPQAQSAIRAALEALGGSEADRALALAQMIEFGLLDAGLQSYAIVAADRGYRLVLRAPPPPPPRLLTGVDLLLADPPGSAVFEYCNPLVEITHPDHDPVRLPMQIDLGSAVTNAEGEEVYGRLTVAIDPDLAISAVPLETLNLRLFAATEVQSLTSPEPHPSSCSLAWGGRFPETALPLAGVSQMPVLPVSVTDDGHVIFAEATLRSTARPVFVLLYNTTGLEDTNGAPLRPDLYPGWTHARGGRDMQSALSILVSSAQAVFGQRVEDLFLLQAAGGVAKGFLPPEPLTAESALRAADALRPGEVGPLNLENELKDLANSTATTPRFVIIGRSGLDAGADYCASPPALPEASRRGSLVIDFLSREAAFDLSRPVQATLINPTGPEAFTEAAERLATRCPEDGSGLVHWVLTPDVADQFKLILALETLAPYLFGGLQ